MIKNILTAAAVIALFAALGIAGTADHEEAERADRYYITMVCAGNWPDYKRQQPQCGEE